MTTIWQRLNAAVSAFRESDISFDPLDEAAFSDFDSRRMRYQIYWSLFENSAFRDIHTWAPSLKESYGLYRYIRNIYNPAYRVGSFWKTHLMGGSLDPEASDNEESALPIDCENELLRPAIAQLWKWSNWQRNKGVYTLWGAVMGDAVLRVIDDTERERVYLNVLHPGKLRDIELDPWGNVRGYIIEEQRLDPRPRKVGEDVRYVTYREVVTRDGEFVHYVTELDNVPYAWNGKEAEWDVPYGFVPMVIAQNINVGAKWGWSELHPGFPQFREVDDIASKLGDQIRKVVESGWFFSGVTPPEMNAQGVRELKMSGDVDYGESNDPEPGREEVPAIYAPDPSARAEPLVASLDIAGVTGHIQSILSSIEANYPELNRSIYDNSSGQSGRSIRIVRQPVEEKAQERRADYDDALVRAQKMAISIGGMRRYRGFESFNIGSYAAGNLEHTVGQRPVFANDPLDDLEREKEFWTAAGLAVAAGFPLESWLLKQDWTLEDMAQIGTQKLAAIQLAQADATAVGNLTLPPGTPPTSPGGTEPGDLGGTNG